MGVQMEFNLQDILLKKSCFWLKTIRHGKREKLFLSWSELVKKATFNLIIFFLNTI